ncbi:DNA-deoxyinosine glycosylase [Thiosulfativibrio zosterae]|uniref:DNA-deoxyinosine glycosylase n=1 Tax=Thiosulfativibrio zosterae TaxID=2675053 RepID=A0A6F8PND0_9GAMM|nr:DNA-deoxyinosine glycosylase [Thiosulfativibrio zosterae]BBP43622.1 DNA-deoxyinosine glycosylase [Thiosulfativibrio zosterae]
MNNHHVVGFQAIKPDQPKVLILGTMPSVRSIEDDFYYAHPRNAFWAIMARYLNSDLQTVEQKTQALLNANIMLWDVLQTCERQGSLDSAIKQPQANDFEALFIENPDLKRIIFNGKAALDLFKKQVLKHQNLPADLELICLPSTSPANAALTLEDKWLFWREILQKIQ